MKFILILIGFLTFSPVRFVKANIQISGNKEIVHNSTSLNNQTDSLDIKIGQLIIFGFYGTSVNTNNAVYKAVAEGKVGSILIYSRNLTQTNTAQNLKDLISNFQSASAIPLFISIDQEGGIVNRLKPELGFPKMPSAKWIGKINNPDTTKYYADNIASTLSGLGINLNYAPVLDVFNPNCPVLGARERCYSKDPEMIIKHAGITVERHHFFGVKTVLKHFPGHGNSLTDSHLGITDVTKTWKPFELLPYKHLIASNLADAVMTAHIVNGKLDPTLLPATLSKKIMTGLLREELGFKGVIFSDDMMMKAISDQYKLEDAIFKAMNAGVDVLMFSNNIIGIKDYEPANIHAIIKKLVKNGQLSEEQINTSFNRVMALKMKN